MLEWTTVQDVHDLAWDLKWSVHAGPYVFDGDSGFD